VESRWDSGLTVALEEQSQFSTKIQAIEQVGVCIWLLPDFARRNVSDWLVVDLVVWVFFCYTGCSPGQAYGLAGCCHSKIARVRVLSWLLALLTSLYFCG